MTDRTCVETDCDSTKIQARGYCAKHYQAWKRRNAGTERVCSECGETYRTIESRSTVCSRACRSRVAQRIAQPLITASMFAARTQVVRYVHPDITIIPGQRWTAGQCSECGTPFVSRYADRTCSPSCHTHAQRRRWSERDHRRRARLVLAYVAPVNRDVIYRRDGYTCQLCREPALMTETAPHPLAPTLDHVIPLARGGTHEPGNVQLAHFICNSIKGDRITNVTTLALTA